MDAGLDRPSVSEPAVSFLGSWCRTPFSPSLTAAVPRNEGGISTRLPGVCRVSVYFCLLFPLPL